MKAGPGPDRAVMTQAARPLLILGMHRSGTSCLAGCMEEAGLYLGAVNKAAPFNKKGNRENRDVMALNDAVLRSAGAAWNAPPATAPVWSDEARATLQSLAASYPADRAWGLKDPRVLLTLDGWIEALNPRFVGTFRHPVEVCASLRRRAEAWKSPMDAEEALSLWTAYNERLAELHERSPFPVLRYDQPVEDYYEKVRSLARALGLPAPDAIGFLDRDLKNEVADTPPPERCRALWDRLTAIAV